MEILSNIAFTVKEQWCLEKKTEGQSVHTRASRDFCRGIYHCLSNCIGTYSEVQLYVCKGYLIKIKSAINSYEEKWLNT